MKTYLTTILFILTAFPALFVSGQNNAVSDNIIAALNKGNASQLSGYFGSTVEIVLLDRSDVYSKQQAASVISGFFNQNTVTKGFQIVHNGTKDATSFMIGNLSTNSGVYRVYVLLRNAEPQTIQQLRIEK
ncbi:MAG: DUF4783 domain-containing protein [Prevotellaceae bacterium]|jgi:hypothetical protein|nr:DUF4783 domain-containing protein [Prevotellaceae bacterium]